MPDPTPNLRDLKVRAQSLKPAIRLGKAGLTPEFLTAFNAELVRAQLVKVRFEDFKEERKSLSRQLAEQSGSQLVQQVGHTAVFFRKPQAVQEAAESSADSFDSQNA